MPDYRSFFDRDYIAAFDLNGKDQTVTISKVEGRTLTGNNGRKDKKPVIFFEGREKGLALNKTNSKTIASMYGNNTDTWVGKSLTLYPTTTSSPEGTVDCIRIRPKAPAPGKEKTDAAS